MLSNDNFTSGNSGMLKLDGPGIAWQMAVIEYDGNKRLENIGLLLTDSAVDDVSGQVMGMLRSLDGKDCWLENGMAGRLTALAMFCRLEELRAACPRIESFSLENEYFTPETVAVELKGSIGESWMIQIVDSKGNAVQSYHGDGCNGQVLWDGRNELGDLCPDGSYRFIGSVVNGEIRASREISGVMDTHAPSVQFVAWL